MGIAPDAARSGAYRLEPEVTAIVPEQKLEDEEVKQ